jgi:RNA polymerase sigma factor (sigma-70 family)
MEAEAAGPSYRPGDQADFERLYLISYPKILGTLIAMLGSRAQAEDLAHDAYERAFKAWSSWRPEASAEAWLHRIAINAAISHLRHERLREVGEVLRRLGRPASPPDPAALTERSELLKALRKLPPKQAAVIVLRHFHGYSNREIGASLGVPERTVASRLAAAKGVLRVLLEQGGQAGLGSSPQSGVGT